MHDKIKNLRGEKQMAKTKNGTAMFKVGDSLFSVKRDITLSLKRQHDNFKKLNQVKRRRTFRNDAGQNINMYDFKYTVE